MKKKKIALLLVFSLIMPTLAACSGGNAAAPTTAPTAVPTAAPTAASTVAPNPTTAATVAPVSAATPAPAAAEVKKDYSKEIKIKVYSRGDVTPVDVPLMDQQRKADFNLVFDETRIPAADYTTKMNLMFAVGEEMDFIRAIRPEWNLAEWTESGFLKGFTKEELKERYSNIFTLWNDESIFDYVFDLLKYSDGLLYSLPGARDSAGNMAWVYREGTFKRLGLEFPTTPDEMFNVMKTIKDDTGLIPYIVNATGSGAPLYAFSGFLQMFGINELQARDYYYYQPVTKEFIPYGAVTEDYREWLKFLNKCYAEGLLYPEFATATADQANAMRTQGHGFLLWGYPGNIDAQYNNYTHQYDKDDYWNWSPKFPTADSSKGTFYKRDPYHLADMHGFGASLSDEKLDRLLDYLNWCLTDEGMTYNTFGKKGVTYEIVNGKPQYLENFAHRAKAQGDKLTDFQVNTSGFLKIHPWSVELYSPVLAEINEKVMGNPDYSFFRAPIMSFTAQESSSLADVVTNLATTRDEFTMKFILGNLNPNNDTDWNSYINAMKGMGLERLQKTVTEVFDRSNK